MEELVGINTTMEEVEDFNNYTDSLTEEANFVSLCNESGV